MDEREQKELEALIRDALMHPASPTDPIVAARIDDLIGLEIQPETGVSSTNARRYGLKQREPVVGVSDRDRELQTFCNAYARALQPLNRAVEQVCAVRGR